MNTNKYIGKIFPVLDNYTVKVIEYYNSKNVIVEFQDEFKAIKKTNIYNLLNGKLKNPYSKSVYNIGMIGNVSNIGKDILYQRWKSMISRCYNINDKSYYLYGAKGVTVCEKWLIFENYKKDIENMENFNKIYQGWHIDKDFSNKKIYSKETCRIISPTENSILANKTKKSNNKTNYIGVCKMGSGYRAKRTIKGKLYYKDFKTLAEAIDYRKNILNKM